VPLAANASDNVAVASVQFFVDGQPVGGPVTSAPYAVNRDTTLVTSGTHVVSAQATDTSGNAGSSGQVTVTATVSGAGLVWTLVKRANTQAGDSEIWEASAPNIIPSATVTSKLGQSGLPRTSPSLPWRALGGVGASATATAASGAPSLSLTTHGAASLVFAIGNDWDRAVART
jgi:hypothetical protein